jgi:hypothetical protein
MKKFHEIKFYVFLKKKKHNMQMHHWQLNKKCKSRVHDFQLVEFLLSQRQMMTTKKQKTQKNKYTANIK